MLNDDALEIDRNIKINRDFAARDFCNYERLRIFYDIDKKKLIFKNDDSISFIINKNNDFILGSFLIHSCIDKNHLQYKQSSKNNTYKYYNFINKTASINSVMSKLKNYCNYVRIEKIDEYIAFVKKRSAKKIQTHWRLSICCPEYTLCRNRIYKEFLDLNTI